MHVCVHGAGVVSEEVAASQVTARVMTSMQDAYERRRARVTQERPTQANNLSNKVPWLITPPCSLHTVCTLHFNTSYCSC